MGTDLSADDQQGQPQEQEQDFTAHPVWSPVLEMFPDGAQRDALLAQIKESERNSSAAIQKARSEAAPEEWRGLIDEAKEVGLTPDELSQAYNNFEEMREQIAIDPDAWLTGMRSEIDAAVDRGDITRKAGAQLKRDATEQAAAGADEPVGLEDPAIAELKREVAEQKQWRAQQEQQWQEEQQRLQEEQDNEDVQQRSQQFIQTFESTFNNDASLANVEPQDRYVVANHAINLLQANENLTEQQAADEAIAQFRRMGALPQAGTRSAPVPIGGGSNQRVQQQTQVGTGDARSVDKTREQAMIEEAMRQAAAGIV